MENLSQDNFTTEKVNVISNCLLGNYVDKQYIITDDIKDELITVKKVKKSVFKNSVFCSAYIVGYGDVVFEVTFQKNTVKSVAMAELFVLENEYKINGYIQNTIRTKVGQYIDDLDNFIEKTYDYFNIELTEHRIAERKEDEETINYINAKRNFNINMSKLTKKDYNKLYRNYVTARLELLKKANNDYSNTVLDKFNGEFAKIEKFFLQDDNYKALSELLDKCIEDVSGVNPKFAQEEKLIVEQLTPVVEDFSKQADEIFEKAQPKAMNSLDKEDKTRMEDIERDMYDYQQNKKSSKENQTKLQDFYDTSSSESKGPKQEESKEEKKVSQQPKQPQKQEQAQAKQPQTTNTPNNTGAVLNDKPTPPNFKVDGPKPEVTKTPEQPKAEEKQPAKSVEQRAELPKVAPNPVAAEPAKKPEATPATSETNINLNITINNEKEVKAESNDIKNINPETADKKENIESRFNPINPADKTDILNTDLLAKRNSEEMIMGK